ncbi:hypothetical protein SAMD00019534_086190 [Acytostelium subglobosum LB1]|uniref:hypothetical protein n=1 Tax=Acytostelium subglobosum LB1 TaxID=1410327 RepID=UPI00064520B6|nr:hypothetical protein SAMD00019534_086190 [Acytostelium subglobosum LB1]GAM25444.1 hypothetical protein SAMD00019534_086190 [Acytostelium subglobosum LB1]|eukprot:XP_012751430.1 hypothetical protein SAMD00019534_086190 [Acytostelium subglobosum LB1]
MSTYFEVVDDDDDEFDIDVFNNNNCNITGGNSFIMSSDMDDVQLADLTDNQYLTVKDHPLKGRSVFAKQFIPRGTLLLKDVPYVSIVDDRYKRNICNSCFKFFNESNRQNIVGCPGCGDIYYCSTFCQLSSVKETKHTDLECRWIYTFSRTYKQQLLDDDRNIVLVILRILARRHNAHLSMDFTTNQVQTQDQAHDHGAIPLPSDVCDLVDHIDEYFGVALKDPASQNGKQQEWIVKDVIVSKENGGVSIGDQLEFEKDHVLNWQHDFTKLLTLSRIIQHIIKPRGHSTNDRDNNSTHCDQVRDSLEVITSTDYNLLKLLGKVRANYFGLWNHSEDQLCHWAGAAVYLRLSLFNHSCFPNCTTLLLSDEDFARLIGHGRGHDEPSYERTNPLTFNIIAMRDIEADSECLITYIPLDQKAAERRNHLKSMWLFDCDCQRCAEELQGKTALETEYKRYCCPKMTCGGGMLIPDIQSTASIPTGTCRATTNMIGTFWTRYLRGDIVASNGCTVGSGAGGATVGLV